MQHTLSLKAKLLSLFGFMALVSVLVGSAGVWVTDRTTVEFEKITQVDVPSIRALNRMLLAFRLARIELLQAIANETTDEADLNSIEVVKAQWESFDADLKRYESLVNSEEQKALFAEWKTHIDEMRDHFTKALNLYVKGKVQTSNEFKEIAKLVYLDIGGQLSVKVRDATKALVDFHSKRTEQTVESAENVSKTGRRINLWVTVLSSAACVIFAFFFSSRLSRSIGLIIEKISHSTLSVSTASEKIADDSRSLSEAVVEQSASLQETTAALEEINSMIAQSSENTSSIDQRAKSSKLRADEGMIAVQEMLSSMEEISRSNNSIMEQVDQSNHQMIEIVKVIQEIADKTNVINDIVFQTKLLSFNASVEAARAGEQGKGFAVVAEEVGNLARMSGEASMEISELLQSSTAKVEAIVSQTKSQVGVLISNGREKVEHGVVKVKRCSEILSEIVVDITSLTSSAAEIALAAREQAHGVAEINKAMVQLDTVTQQNSGASNRASTFANSLAKEAEVLKSSVDDLVVTVMGSSSPSDK